MTSLKTKLKFRALILKGILIYKIKGPPCKSWSLKTWLVVYMVRHGLSTPPKDMVLSRQKLDKMTQTQVKNSRTEKILIHDKFRQRAHDIVKDHLKKAYGDDMWYDQESHWSNAKPLEAEWIIPNHLTLSSQSKVIFYIHGGGYMFGSFGMYRISLEKLGTTTDSAVLGVRYRLAPDYSAPCWLEDVLAQILYLISPIDDKNPSESGVGLSLDQILVSGDSAGGGLSSTLIHFMRECQLGKLAGALLYSPWLDVTASHPSCVECAHTDLLPPFKQVTPSEDFSTEKCHGQWINLYRASDESIKKAMLKRGHPHAPLKYINSPIVSPLCDTKFRDLPPILIITGEVELLRDESYLYHELINSSYTEQELKESKIPPSTLHLYEEMFHVFPMIRPGLDASKVSFARASNFIRQCFAVKLENFEQIKVDYLINTDLLVDQDALSRPRKWLNLFMSNLDHQLLPFTPMYPRGHIHTWGQDISINSNKL